jgi:hypothetical protein
MYTATYTITKFCLALMELPSKLLFVITHQNKEVCEIEENNKTVCI